MPENSTNISHKEFLNALISGNHFLCSELFDAFIEKNLSIIELYENLIKKTMYAVGDLWEYNKISVATEHMASAIVEAILNKLYIDLISKERKHKTIIASCIENEFHQIGIKMISDIFEMNGWNAIFLGSNTPTHELLKFAKITKPDMIAISLSIYFNLPNLEHMISMIRKEFPDLTILVGGQAFRHGGQDVLLKYENVVYKPDLNSTELFIKNFK